MTAVALACLLLPAAAVAQQPAARSAGPQWASASTATIHPGVQLTTKGTQCTANFVFSDGVDVFIGQAAHCSSRSDLTKTDGCIARSWPLGTPVEISGASKPGRLVYNSWVAMRAAGETDPDTCQYNDFALVRIDPADVAAVNPLVPRFGGPTGLRTDGLAELDGVYSYQNSDLRLEWSTTSAKSGWSLGDTASGWNHDVWTVTPGIPGDSGSGFLDADGRAFGVLSTVGVDPLPLKNGVGDLARELAYLHTHSTYDDVELVAGTEPFTPGL